MKWPILFIFLILFSFVYADNPLVNNIETVNLTSTSTTITFSCNPENFHYIYDQKNIFDFALYRKYAEEYYRDDQEHNIVGRENYSDTDYRYKSVTTFNISNYFGKNVTAFYYLFHETDQISYTYPEINVWSNYTWNYTQPDCNSNDESAWCWNNITQNSANFVFNYSNMTAGLEDNTPLFEISTDLQGAIDINDTLYTLLLTSHLEHLPTGYLGNNVYWFGDHTHLNDPQEPTDMQRIYLDNLTFCNYTVFIYTDSGMTAQIYNNTNTSILTNHTFDVTGLVEGRTYYVNISYSDGKEYFSSDSTFTFTTTDIYNFEEDAKPEYMSAFIALASLAGLFVLIMIGVVLVFFIKQQGFSFENTGILLNKGMMSFLLAAIVIILCIVLVVIFSNII